MFRGLPKSSFPIFFQASRTYTTKPSISNLAKIYILPIRNSDTSKPYVHFKYNEQLLNNKSIIIKYENKLTTKAANGWKSLSESEKPINKKIVSFVTKLMEQIPWIENSMLSFPSQSALLRQVKSIDGTNEPVLKAIHDLDQNHLQEVLSIPVYYPGSLISEDQLRLELTNLAESNEVYFKKQMLINSLLLPLTLPVALVPVVPNVPGFYLAYRVYCNFKASLGVQHLIEMINRGELKFIDSDLLNGIYEANAEHHDEILLNEKVVDDVIQTLNLEEIKPSLIKALHQETKAYEHSIKK